MMENSNYIESKSERKLIKQLFWCVLSVCLLVNGARLASSDENAIFLLTESIVSHGTLDVPSNIIDNGSLFNGKFYIWAEVGEAILVIPFYIVGKVVSSILPVGENFKLLLIKGIVSTMNAFIGAFLAVIFFRCNRKFSYSIRTSLFFTLALCFGTFLFPYLKTISRDVQLAFCLLGSFYCLYSYKLEPDGEKKHWVLYAGICAASGVLIKMVFLLNIPFLGMYLLHTAYSKKEKYLWVKKGIEFSLPFVGVFCIIALYNYLRFENIYEMGYHGGTTFPTPLYYGIYGLLLSTGKGFFFFAPITILLLWSSNKFFERFRYEAILIFSLMLINLVLYAKYIAWAGDGSWGPRYLIAILPLAVLPLGIFFQDGKQFVRRIAIVLAVIGFLIQLGGVSVYFGNYLREIGEFPYEKGFDNPEFLAKSHFNPAYSPIIGHWSMMYQNWNEHISGALPSLIPPKESNGQRIPLTKEGQQQLLHTYDYWFTYGLYAGFPIKYLLALFFLVLLIVLIQLSYLYTSMKHAYVDSLLHIQGESR